MLSTNATNDAGKAARRAVMGRRPILHIVTDDLYQVMAIMDQAFFEYNYDPSRPDGMSANYYDLRTLIRDKKAVVKTNPPDPKAAQGAGQDVWTALIDHKVVIYTDTGKDGSLDGTVLEYLMDFQERHRKNVYSSRNCLLGSRVVIYGRKLKLPDVLESHVARIDIPSLYPEDFSTMLESVYGNTNQDKKNKAFQKTRDDMAGWYANQLAGFQEHEVRDLLQGISYGKDPQKRLFDKAIAEAVIRKAKNSRLKAHDKLECIDVTAEVSGLESVTEWIGSHKSNIIRTGFSREEDITKGLLLLGLPGTGKSLLAKKCARLLGLPLIKLDISRLLGKYVGESEANMDQMLEDLTVAGAPCVLWIDEIDKAFSGVGQGGGDGSAVMDRLFGKLLTFMQEMSRPVFLVTTANDISKLPPELFRSGRFSQLFSLMLPSYKECVKIMRAKLEHHLGVDAVDGNLPEVMMDFCCGLKRWKDGRLVDTKDWKAVRFLTGADISEMAKEMCVHLGILPGNGNSMRFKREVLYDAMQKAANGRRTSVDPRFPMTLQRAAESYCKALEQGTVSANDPGTPGDAKLYQPGEVKKDAGKNPEDPQCLRKPDKFAAVYDEALYRRIGLAMDAYIRKTQQ